MVVVKILIGQHMIRKVAMCFCDLSVSLRPLRVELPVFPSKIVNEIFNRIVFSSWPCSTHSGAY